MAMRIMSFPFAREPRLVTTAELNARGFSLRSAGDSDLNFLRTLYGVLRHDELACTGWHETAVQAFLDSQFALQHHHYVSHFATADFLIVEHVGVPIGRIYLHHAPTECLLVDISLQPAWRGQGLGTALIRQAQQCALGAGVGLSLHVELRNPSAHRLYERLGFVGGLIEGQHMCMHWAG
jgi:GNAT superfamily N-acetyltransferase